MDIKKEIDRFLLTIKGTVRDNTYVATYCNSMRNHIYPYLADKDIKQINQTDIQLFLNEQMNKYSYDTVKKDKSCMCMFFDYLIDNHNYKGVNPVRKIRMKRKPIKRVDNDEIYNPDELEMIYEFAYAHRFGYEIQILIDLAITRSELLGLKWSNIDFERKALRICNDLVEVHGSNYVETGLYLMDTKNEYRYREVPIPDRLINILADRKKKSSSDYVVCNKFNDCCNPTMWYRRHYKIFFDELCELTGIKYLSTHRLRHSRLSQLVNDNKNLYAIAKFAGHSDLEMLRQRYAHSDTEQLRKLLDM